MDCSHTALPTWLGLEVTTAGRGSSYCKSEHFGSSCPGYTDTTCSEGAFTVLVAALAWMVIPDWPETATFIRRENEPR